MGLGEAMGRVYKCFDNDFIVPCSLRYFGAKIQCSHYSCSHYFYPHYSHYAHYFYLSFILLPLLSS